MFLSSSNRTYPLSHCYHIFPWLCAWDYIMSLTANIFRDNHEFVFIIIVQFMMSANSWIRFDLQRVFVCFTLYHLIVIIVQAYLKTLNLLIPCHIYFVECVHTIKHILSVIHYTICEVVCFQFTHFVWDDWENIYSLSYCHHQIESMNYYPLFSMNYYTLSRVRSWNNDMSCLSWYSYRLHNVVKRNPLNKKPGCLLPVAYNLPQGWFAYL